jgi:hypothetical protein
VLKLLSDSFCTSLKVYVHSMLAPLYMAEISPPEVRGSLMALEQFSIVLGVVFGFWIGFLTRDRVFVCLIHISLILFLQLRVRLRGVSLLDSNSFQASYLPLAAILYPLHLVFWYFTANVMKRLQVWQDYASEIQMKQRVMCCCRYFHC